MKKVLIFLVCIVVGSAFAETKDITWKANGTTYATSTCEVGGDLIIPQTNPTKYGYHFVGWLPPYTFLEYIESTGTQYIDTGVVPVDGFGFWMDIYFENQMTTSVASTKFLGSSLRNGGLWGGIVIATYPVKTGGQMTWFSYPTLENMYDPGLVSGTRMQISSVNNVYSTSLGYSVLTPYRLNENIYGSLYLFNVHTEDPAITLGFRCYGCKLFDGTNVVRNFIPARRNSDNAIGMYDTVTGTFFENAGARTFIAGPEIQ